jgi:hypothetical protein
VCWIVPMHAEHTVVVGHRLNESERRRSLVHMIRAHERHTTRPGKAESRRPWRMLHSLGRRGLCRAQQPLCEMGPDWHPSNLTSQLVDMLRAGVGGVGDLARLRRFLRRLRAGRPVLVAAIGASVVADYGGAIGYMQDRQGLGLVSPSMRMVKSCWRGKGQLMVNAAQAHGKGEVKAAQVSAWSACQCHDTVRRQRRPELCPHRRRLASQPNALDVTDVCNLAGCFLCSTSSGSNHLTQAMCRW